MVGRGSSDCVDPLSFRIRNRSEGQNLVHLIEIGRLRHHTVLWIRSRCWLASSENAGRARRKMRRKPSVIVEERTVCGGTVSQRVASEPNLRVAPSASMSSFLCVQLALQQAASGSITQAVAMGGARFASKTCPVLPMSTQHFQRCAKPSWSYEPILPVLIDFLVKNMRVLDLV